MRWTTQGIAGLPAWRERVEEGERIIEAAGGSLVGVYVTLGRYDVVEIFEAPDDAVAIEILMKLQRFGPEQFNEAGLLGRHRLRQALRGRELLVSDPEEVARGRAISAAAGLKRLTPPPPGSRPRARARPRSAMRAPPAGAWSPATPRRTRRRPARHARD